MDNAAPLTHHEIITLAEPFVRGGHQPDLAASDRAARRLQFRPRSAGEGRVETLWLEPIPDRRGPEVWQLTRQLRVTPDAAPGQPAATPLSASLVAQGGTPTELLVRVEAVPVASQLTQVEGIVVALSHRLPAPSARHPAPDPVLTDAVARIEGVQLSLRVPRVHSMPGEWTLQVAPGSRLAASEDLLAVLGLAWSRLSLSRGAWRGTVELKRREPARSADALDKLRRTAGHLAHTLAAPPARFHSRHNAARWRVTLRRATPALVALGLIGLSAAVPVLGIGEGSLLRMLVFNAPPLLMVWFFSMREMPRIEIPPMPRPLTAPAWLAADAKSAPGHGAAPLADSAVRVPALTLTPMPTPTPTATPAPAPARI